MVYVRINYARDSGSGGPVPVNRGTITATPTRKRVENEKIVVPAPFSVDLISGAAALQLTPTTPEWCWKIVARLPGMDTITEYVVVPNIDTIDYVNLQRVDPETLETVHPDPAWWAALRNGLASAVPGPKGDKGDKGDSIRGSKGADSVVPGPRGLKGDKGDSIRGFKGDKGDPSTVPGPPGDKGDKGDSIKGDKGDKGDSIKGDKGDKGDTGTPGATAPMLRCTFGPATLAYGASGAPIRPLAITAAGAKPAGKGTNDADLVKSLGNGSYTFRDAGVYAIAIPIKTPLGTITRGFVQMIDTAGEPITRSVSGSEGVFAFTVPNYVAAKDETVQFQVFISATTTEAITCATEIRFTKISA